MGPEFPLLLLIIGGLLVLAAGLSGWLHGAVLSISVLAVTCGVVFAATGILRITASSDALVPTIELALVATLWSDGLTAEQELLRERWRDPARALAAALPLTLVFTATFAMVVLPEIAVAEALLLGAILAPTDPVVTSSILSSERVPVRVRHALNLESGLNDGLALPFVLLFLALAEGQGDTADKVARLAVESVVGVGVGVALAFASARAARHLRGGGILPEYAGVYAFGTALAVYGLAETVGGNGLVAAFSGGLAFALTAREIPERSIAVNESVSSILQVVTFLLFGSLIVTTGFHGSIPALAAMVVLALVVARPLAVVISFARSSLAWPEIAFVAWFGPRGVASMLFALLVVHSQVPHRFEVFEVASYVVLASVLAHGLTDTVGARALSRRTTERAAPP